MNRQAFSPNLRTRGKSHHRVLVDLGYTHSTADRLRIPNPLEVKKKFFLKVMDFTWTRYTKSIPETFA